MCRLLGFVVWVLVIGYGALPNNALGVEISVRVFAKQLPKDVTIQGDLDAAPRPLNLEAAKAVFRAVLTQSPAIANKKPGQFLQAGYTLAANWDDGTEQLYLRLGPGAPPQMDFEVHHEDIRDDFPALLRIEGLGNDYRSMLRKYFASRAFHRKWQADRTTEVAIRSAKLWFDASYTLATKKGSVLGMDPDVVKAMNDYEEEARRDHAFRNRLRKHIREGYIQGMLAFVNAQDFALASLVPELISKGEVQTADFINTSLIDKWMDLSSGSQKQIVKLHGVNLPLLKNNKEFIRTLQK